ncbi:glycosyltransferase [Streptomyces pathocidini]|uniref:D-inositol 3-phosphate glycosyltransferase n=1 Tax=Streptomyces pathocidini TaxID=1650571 RepID=A0ABW7UP70_9ACTN|nr:glycosyltransferase [Streptomyces pathocidini]
MPGLINHEWIERSGGAERVLDAFVDLYPDAEVLCLWNDAQDRYPGTIVRESLLARTPLRGRKAAALPLMPAVWRGVRNRGYDWVLTSSHLFAHHLSVRGLAAGRHFVYAHTPARYLWASELDGRGSSLPVRAVSPIFRRVDRRRGRDLFHVAANSAFVRDRIRRAWDVDARVIHPPVRTAELAAVADWAETLDATGRALLDTLPDTFVLGASRFVPYKRLDLVIRAGSAVGLPVVIAGCGPGERQLRAAASRAGVPVHFVIAPGDALLRALMQRALVYVFPPVEDFGIMPVEAMALGTPVVVNAVGGAAESTVEGVTGAWLRDETDASLREGVEAATTLDPQACSRHALRFGHHRFQDEIADWMGTLRADNRPSEEFLHARH